MNSIIRNVNLLKVPFYVSQKAAPAQVIEHLIKFPKKAASPLYSPRSSPLLTSLKNVEPMYDKYTRKYDANYKTVYLTNRSPPPNQVLSKLSVNTNYKTRRLFSSRKGRRDDKKLRQDDVKRKQRDSTCGTECINIREKRIKKKKKNRKTDFRPHDIKSLLNLNEMLARGKQEISRMNLQGRNRINNFIFKPNNCRSCEEKKKKDGKATRFRQQNRHNCSYPIMKRIYPKHDIKKRAFKRTTFKQLVTPTQNEQTFAYCIDKIKEKRTKSKLDKKEPKIKDKNLIGENKQATPLYLIIKGLSSKPRTEEEKLRNIKFKFNTNNNYFNVEKALKSVSDTILHAKDNDIKRTSMAPASSDAKNARNERTGRKGPAKIINRWETKNRKDKNENFLFKSEKFLEEKAEPLDAKEQMQLEAYKEQMAKIIGHMLKPVIEQEYLKYKEVKTALQRLENNLEKYFKDNKDMQLFQNESVSNEPVVPPKLQEETNHPAIKDKTMSIQEAFSRMEIKDPASIYKEIEAFKKPRIIIPDFDKEDIITNPSSIPILNASPRSEPLKGDPLEGLIKIADSCKKDDPCKKKDPCKKEDPCKKDNCKKDDPCKKKDPCKKCSSEPEPCIPCKKADSCKKEDPCKKKDPCKKEDPCKKKDDPCKKKDPCKKCSSDPDPCNPCKKADSCKKDDPCKKKDPCKKEDPCKKDNCKKDDPCKKKDPCKRCSSAPDPCNPCKKADSCKKDDPCKKKDPCKKEDPCKKDNCKKDDPCKKKDPCKKCSGDPFDKMPCKRFNDPCQKDPCLDPNKIDCTDPCKKNAPCQSEPVCKRKMDKMPPCSSQLEIRELAGVIIEHKDVAIELAKGKPCLPSKLDKRYCPKCNETPAEPTLAKSLTCKKPRTRQPPPPDLRPPPPTVARQSSKRSWTPVKIEIQKKKAKEYSRSESNIPRPRLNTTLPKIETPKKGFINGCKGLLDSVCKAFSPKKTKHTGPKGAVIGVATSLSMPELRNIEDISFMCNPADIDGANNRLSQKIGLRYYTEMKGATIRDKYPWKKVTAAEAKSMSKIKKGKGGRKRKVERNPFDKEEVFFCVRSEEEKIQATTKETGEKEDPKKETQGYKKEKPKLWRPVDPEVSDSAQKSCRSIHTSCGQLSGSAQPESQSQPASNEKSEDSAGDQPVKNCTLKIERKPEEAAVDHLNRPTSSTENAIWKHHLEDVSQERFITLFTIKQEQEKAWKVEEKEKNDFLQDSFAPKVNEDEYIFSDIMRQIKPKEDCEQKNKEALMAIKKDPKCEPKKEPKKEDKKDPCKPKRCNGATDQNFTNQCAQIAALPPRKEFESTKSDFDGDDKESGKDRLICKVRKAGPCGERLVCEEMPPNKKPSELNLKAEGDIIRVLQCKMIKGALDKQILTCQEIKLPAKPPPSKPCPDATEELKHIFKESKQQAECSKPKKKKMTIGQRLVCKAESLECSKSGEKYMACKVMEVKEERLGECPKKPQIKIPKQSPFTYMQLLETSAKLRKANDMKLAKEGEKKKKGKK